MQASNALSLSTLFSIFLYEIMGVEDGLSLKSSIWKERRFFGVFDIDFFDDNIGISRKPTIFAAERY